MKKMYGIFHYFSDNFNFGEYILYDVNGNYIAFTDISKAEDYLLNHAEEMMKRYGCDFDDFRIADIEMY
jgi:hypothetical protein